MGEAIETALIGSPIRWILVFNRQARTPLMSLIAMGRYKHVRAMGYVLGLKTWLFYDVTLGSTQIIIAKGAAAETLMSAWLYEADAIEFKAHTPPSRMFMRFGFWCVPAMKHLIGIPSCAWRPDRFWRDCLQHGGIVIRGHAEPPAGCSRPDVQAVGRPSAAGPN